MSSSISLSYNSQLTVVETLNGAYVSGSDNTVTFTGLNESGTLSGSTTPPVTKHAIFSKAMTAGAATIDLTALPGQTADETIDLSGLKVQALKFKNKSTNANKITIAKGASNGYGLNSAGDTWSITLDPNQSVGPFLLDDAAPDVGSGAKTIDISGTGTQELEIEIVAG